MAGSMPSCSRSVMWSGLADDADGLMAVGRDEPAELPGDLSVAARDDDAHLLS